MDAVAPEMLSLPPTGENEPVIVEGEYKSPQDLCVNGGTTHACIPAFDGYAYCNALGCGARFKILQ